MASSDQPAFTDAGPPATRARDQLALGVLRERPGWAAAVENLNRLVAVHGVQARASAVQYANVYTGRRGAMVFDVVASRQRKYRERVLPLVARWEENSSAPTLRELASAGVEAGTYGLRRAEPTTMQQVASNLLSYAEQRAVSEDEACLAWANGVDGLEHAHQLDPIVGGVSGIGVALFLYMRMRSGANTLKPDLRVTAGLRNLGFTLPGDAHTVLVIARAAAAEVDVDLLTLDQLLWSME